jgi:uncharacterized protein (UPF0128 family)
MIDKNK